MVIYLITAYGQDKPRKIIFHTLLMTAIWLTIKICLNLIFDQNPGSLFRFHLFDNFRYLTNPWNILLVLSNFGFLWILVLICFRRIPDPFIRRSQVVALPFFGGMFLVAAIVEIRDFGELIPLVLTAFLLILKEFARAGSNQGPRRIKRLSSIRLLDGSFLVEALRAKTQIGRKVKAGQGRVHLP